MTREPMHIRVTADRYAYRVTLTYAGVAVRLAPFVRSQYPDSMSALAVLHADRTRIELACWLLRNGQLHVERPRPSRDAGVALQMRLRARGCDEGYYELGGSLSDQWMPIGLQA